MALLSVQSEPLDLGLNAIGHLLVSCQYHNYQDMKKKSHVQQSNDDL